MDWFLNFNVGVFVVVIALIIPFCVKYGPDLRRKFARYCGDPLAVIVITLLVFVLLVNFLMVFLYWQERKMLACWII